jgi:pimeloyl-ACP methyl ester carboxylesterase
MAYYTPVAPLWPDRPPAEAPLVFLHSLGGGSSAFEWSKVYPAFASTHRIIAPDLIGWGQSVHPQRNYRVDDYLTMIAELIEQSNTTPAIVFASSLTAGITIRLATQRPELFRQLILVCPSGYSDFGGAYSQGLAAQAASIPGLDRVIYSLGAANELAVRNFLQEFLFAERSRLTDEIVAAYLASAQQNNAEYAALSTLRGDQCFDLALYIDQLKVPTVFLWGEKSRFGSVTLGRRLQSLNSGAIDTFYEIPYTGVLPHLENPAVVIGLVRSHLLA